MYCPEKDGGHFKYTKALLEHLHTPCVWATANQSVRLEKHEVASGYWVNRVPTRTIPEKVLLLLRHLKNMQTFILLCFRKKVKIIHIQSLEPISLWLSYFALRRVAKYIIISVHNVDPHGFETKTLGRLERHLAHRLFKKADLLFVFSTQGRDFLVDHLMMPAGKVHLLPMALLEKIPDDPPQRKRPVNPRFLFFGAYRSNKGLDVLLDAFILAKEKGLAGVLVIRGKYPQEIDQSIRLRFRSARLEHSLDYQNAFIGEEEIDAIFRDADVLLLPYTQFASQSGVVFLGYAYRLPIIASAVGGLPDVIREDHTGILVEPGNARSLSGSLFTILTDYNKFISVDTIGLLKQKYSWELIGNLTDAQYRTLLDRS